MTIYNFNLDFFPKLILTTRSWNIAKIELMITLLYPCMWKSCDVVPSHTKDLKMEQKTKVAHNCGFFLRFFFLTHFDHWKPKYGLQAPDLGPYFSKMVVEIAFLDQWTSLISQIVTHSSHNETVFGEILNPPLSSLKSVIFLLFSQKMAFFGRLMHGMSYWNIFTISPSNNSCNRTYLTT